MDNIEYELYEQDVNDWFEKLKDIYDTVELQKHLDAYPNKDDYEKKDEEPLDENEVKVETL